MCLEHERDLTNSSSERIILAETSILTHYIILQMNQILKNLHLNEERIKNNLYLLGGRQCSEHLMIKLAGKIGRQEAHKLLKQLSNTEDFYNAVLSNELISQYFTEQEIREILEPTIYLGLAPKVAQHVVEIAAKNTKKREDTQ